MSDGEKCLYENLLYLYHTKLPRQKSSRHPKINPTLPQINPTTPQNKSYVTPPSSRILHQFIQNTSPIIQNTSFSQFWSILVNSISSGKLIQSLPVNSVQSRPVQSRPVRPWTFLSRWMCDSCNGNRIFSIAQINYWKCSCKMDFNKRICLHIKSCVKIDLRYVLNDLPAPLSHKLWFLTLTYQFLS